MSAGDPTKRVFSSVGDSSEFLKKPEKNAGSGSGKSKTIRFELELFEPDEFKFPEFNYKKLVHIEKKKQKKIAKLPNGNHSDPFAPDEDVDVARITRELEEKYGSGSSYSKSSRLTTVDRGAGYDATDSFIDDTEAYDELIPEEVETDRGGFYINSGALEFRKLSNYERPGDEIRMPKAKKRVISSSESSDSEGEKDPEKAHKPNHVVKKVKTATSSSDEQGKAAKKLKKEKPEKQEKSDKPEKVDKAEKPKEIVKPVKEPVKEPEKKKPAEKEPEKVVKTTTVKDMLRLQRDNMRKMEQAKPTSSGATTATENDDEEGEVESVSSLAVSESSRDSSHTETAPVNGAKEISLPENLPVETVALIAALKAHAAANPNSKSSFFESNVLDLLVNIDSGAKGAGATSRIQTFNYLETFVPCSKKNLFAKIRKHRVSQQEGKVKNEITKLRKIIHDSMPAEVLKYEQDMKKHEENLQVQSVVGDTSFIVTTPRKRFHWNDNSRFVLSEIVRHLRDLFKIGKHKETEDELLLRKLQTDVLPLWPEGWIKPEDIQKELERKKKKEARASSVLAQISTPNSQTKTNTASPATNGKASAQAHKTETQTKNTELEATVVNGKASSHNPSDAVSPSSVIKRSSDHSINSIISASPSPPTTSQALKAQDSIGTRVIDLDKLTSPSELMKVAQPTPKFNLSPISNMLTQMKVLRSDSSDSDCVEIVGEFNPIKPAKSLYNHNNKVNHSSSAAYHAPIAKKSKTHGSDDGGDTDYQKVILGIQSLTDPKKTNQFLMQNPLTSSVSQPQLRKAEASHGGYDLNGSSDHFLDPQLPAAKNFNQNNNLHYSICDLMTNSSRVAHDGSPIKGNNKSGAQHKPALHINHQQQLTSSTNNNLHSISLSLTPPSSHITPPGHDRKTPSTNNHLMSILNLSNKK